MTNDLRNIALLDRLETGKQVHLLCDWENYLTGLPDRQMVDRAGS